MPAVKLRIRSKVLVKLIKPYTRVKLQWLCRQLNATMPEVENLVVNLILDNSINGRLDQIHSLLDLNYSEKQDKLYGAMDSWISSVARLRNSIAGRTGRSDYGGRMGGMAPWTRGFRVWRVSGTRLRAAREGRIMVGAWAEWRTLVGW